MNDCLIVAENLHKSYSIGGRAVDVLRGIDLSVQHGEFVAMRGASGAGKSTLLHLLGGIDTPNVGKVKVEGIDINLLSPGQLARFRNTKIGFIFQAYHLFQDLDALENVCVPARLGRVSASVCQEKARHLLECVGLSHRINHRPVELSGGEQQRVAIARSLINDPTVILADEPTGNLDSHSGSEIMDLLCSLQAERKTTMLVATHDIRVATRAHRIIELLDGRITLDNT
jgi:ABC-type lipoprotein export system ATPase subunit